MEIPIQNVYYLLCYAWNKLDESNIVDVSKIDSTSLVDLFAKVLITGTTHLLKRGIDRNYLNYSDELRTIRGKIEFNNSLKRNLFENGKAYCSFDELDHNVIHNQILKTTFYNLIFLKELNDELRKELLHLYNYFHQINSIHLTERAFGSVRLHRNNYIYYFLMNICELIFQSLLPDEESGVVRFRDFLRDENKMGTLFENFVLNFYAEEQKIFKVKKEEINWKFESFSEESKKLLPILRTDVSLIAHGRKIIIETKFYKEIFTNRYGNEKFHSSHLMQLSSYLNQSEDGSEINRHSEGVLIYAATDKKFVYDYTFGNHKLKFCTLNLNQDWQFIKEDLLNLVN
jgi:5-methylcytosine-specific restriction enzyme subunit McrC